MAKMTRADARGVLAQLVKQQQATLTLVGALEADIELEAGVAQLRTEHDKLTAAVSAAGIEAAKARDATGDAVRELAKTRTACVIAQTELDKINSNVMSARRNAERELAELKTGVEKERVRWDGIFAAEQQSKTTLLAREHAAARDTLNAEIADLQQQKAGLTRDLDQLLSRFSR